MTIDLAAKLLEQRSTTYNQYYAGKMSYRIHGDEWNKFVRNQYGAVADQTTSENVFKDVVDLYAENLIPTDPVFTGMHDGIVGLLTRGECIAIRTAQGTLVWPERYEVMSDGNYTIAAAFTRSLRKQEDYCTIIDSEGVAHLYSRPVPQDMSTTNREGYQLVEEEYGHTLYHLVTGDRGMGASLASLQDRINHSIIDQTIIAEMYARPFWYLLNYSAPPHNPYLPEDQQPSHEFMKEQPHKGASGRVFATSSEGPFGQLEPPTLNDMVAYHESLIHKVSQSWGIPEYYLRPTGGNAPSGTSLKVMSQRFNNRVNNLRLSLEPELMRIANDMGATGMDESELWTDSNDLLQDSLDQHGLALTQMGMPRDYVAEVVAPGVDMDDYEEEGGLPGGASVSFGSAGSPAAEMGR
nr:MAG TPA: portal [Caudoviricetes sp.]